MQVQVLTLVSPAVSEGDGLQAVELARVLSSVVAGSSLAAAAKF
jgi:hypothetical protein